MKVLHRPASKGKTMDLIALSHNTRDVIVCFNKDEACRVFSVANGLGYRIIFPITYAEFNAGDYHNMTGVLFDNADRFIQNLSKVEVKAITLTEATNAI